jgi:hypothetical protein
VRCRTACVRSSSARCGSRTSTIPSASSSSIDGLQGPFPPLRTEKEEPLDFGERLSRKIQADVERRLELGLSGATDEAVKGTARLALLGLVPLAMLIGMVLLVIVVAVLLFRALS